ncbi:MAG: toxin-antitoxin system YwqK family antitoxin [Sphingobacteriales bacterium]|nr:toxin-antitoxin system YwqK family antitoxin [Sphingobacteriales bacterium]
MNFFGFRTVSRPIVSRHGAGYLLLWFFLLSCRQKNETTKPEIKIAKTVPTEYRNATDSNFSNHQDTVYYRDKFFTGFRYVLYPNGDTAVLQSYFNGVEEGTQKKWHPNKQLAEKRFYINGRKEGLHQSWWPDGKPKFVFTTHNDEYNGELKEWYSSGLLAKEFHYLNGKEEGSQRLWWDNGTVRANYVIKNGKKYGLIGMKLCNNPYDSVITK